MIDEGAFHAAIDAAPEDAAPRLVFADWLEELGDERAEGYRAMGRLGRVPLAPNYNSEHTIYHRWAWVDDCNVWGRSGAFGDGDILPHALPVDWIGRVENCPMYGDTNLSAGWREWPTRRETEDAAARAFARLPEDRREELLKSTAKLPPTAGTPPNPVRQNPRKTPGIRTPPNATGHPQADF
jgi:uncharacterized protein (TIGR02996 family)